MAANPRASFRFPVEIEDLLNAAVKIVEQANKTSTATDSPLSVIVTRCILLVVEELRRGTEMPTVKASEASEAKLAALRAKLSRLPRTSKGNGTPIAIRMDAAVRKALGFAADSKSITLANIVIACVKEKLVDATRELAMEHERWDIFSDPEMAVALAKWTDHLSPDGAAYGFRGSRLSPKQREEYWKRRPGAAKKRKQSIANA